MAPTFESPFSIRSILSDASSTGSNSDEETNNNTAQSNNEQNSSSEELQTSCSNSSNEDSDQRPPYTYSALIVMAIRSSPKRLLTLNEICSWIADKFPYYQNKRNTWQNSIRHNLSINQCFRRVPRPLDDPGRGHYWTIDPSAEDVTIGETTGRLRRKDSIPLNQYARYQHHHHHFHSTNHQQVPTSHYAIYLPTPEQMIAMQHQSAIQEQQMWNSYNIYQGGHHNQYMH